MLKTEVTVSSIELEMSKQYIDEMLKLGMYTTVWNYDMKAFACYKLRSIEIEMKQR